jgi:hypothetical protein
MRHAMDVSLRRPSRSQAQPVNTSRGSKISRLPLGVNLRLRRVWHLPSRLQSQHRSLTGHCSSKASATRRSFWRWSAGSL